MRTTRFAVILALAFVFAATQASALVISEAEPNNSLTGAQNIDGSFSLGSDPNIYQSDTIPWVSITGTGNGETDYDYYSFTATAGMIGYFDIDFTSLGFDTMIALWNSDWIVVDYSDDDIDWADNGGVSGGNDSFMRYEFTQSGTYYVGVAEYDESLWPNDWGTWYGDSDTFIDADDIYTLQVSLGNTQTGGTTEPVPEPGTLMLLGAGLLGLAGFRKMKR